MLLADDESEAKAMGHRWVALGSGVGLLIGIVAGPTLRADEPSPKQGAASEHRQGPVARALQTSTETKFVEIEPIRAFDSRLPAYTPSNGIFAPDTSRQVRVANAHDASGAETAHGVVPPGATAVAYNITITGATGPNFMAVTPGVATGFTASAINFDGTSDVANGGVVAIDHIQTVKVWNGNQGGSAHVIIDVTGYFVKPLFAQVAADGTLTMGSRVLSVIREGTGGYEVRFDRDVTGCAKTATIGAAGTEIAGLIDTGDSVHPERVKVFTQAAGVPTVFADRAFHLVVTC